MGWDKLDRSDFEDFKSYIEGRLGAIDSNIVGIGQKLAETTPELVEDVKVFRDKAEEHLAVAQKSAEDSEAIFKLMDAEKVSVTALNAKLQGEVQATLSFGEQLKVNVTESQKLRMDLTNSKAVTDQNVIEISALLETAKGLAKQAEDVPKKIETADKLQSQCEGLRDNIQGMVNHSLERKNQIDQVNIEIFGQDVATSDDKSEHVDGIRDNIRKSFDKAELDLKDLIGRAHSDVDSVTDQLRALLPGGMAAGLSAAYEAKADVEIASLRRLDKQFIFAILSLMAVSLIPFAVDIYLLSQGKEFLDVLRLTPVLQILPVYFPALWFTYSTSKKVNLSKRLIEEYTHKSVLGKTFSGLSNQIDSLPKESAVAHELRTRLLYNVLQVSAENPGKLISDYNKADHPVMEALETSSKLSDSIEALERIPGFKQLTKWLTKEKEGLEEKISTKVAAGIDAAEALTKSVK